MARQRARAGDCANALNAFDSAIRNTIEPTLRRDRGLCHEKLGDPFPAIDDYRAYLSARPDAPDGDQIRDRLARLEEQVGVGGRSSRQVSGDDSGSGSGDSAGASASVSVGGDGASASSSSSSSRSKRSSDKGRSFDAVQSEEKLADAADNSPLRYGTGFIVGPFLMVPRYLIGDGAPKESGFVVGAALRYSFSPSMTFITEVGYAGVGTSGAVSSLAGPIVLAGFEARIALNQWASDLLFVGGGPGYEHYTVSGTRVAVNVFELRGRFGYRHVFGPSIGVEVSVDGGPAYFKADEVDGKTFGVIGTNFAFLVGF